MHPTTIEINSQQFISNLKAIKEAIGPKVKFLLPVKANAYGHGLIATSKLAESYVDYLAVACLYEGALLRKNNIQKPILVFGAIDEDQIPGLIDNDLEITISSLYKAKLVANFCNQINKRCRIHIKVDTGMNRVGVRPESLTALVEFVLSSKSLDLVGLYSHLAASDDLDNSITSQQIEIFKACVNVVKQRKADVICHIANSAGVCYHPDSHFDMVRPGIMSYGYFPAKRIDNFPLNQIKPCFSLKSRVAYFKVVPAGSGISYNHRYITKESTRIVTLPIGYGDGYRRGLTNIGEVLLNGKRYTISGTICMDMLMVDIGPNGSAYVGDEAVLIGNQGQEEVSIEKMAIMLNTIVYEVLVSFNERIPRIYTAFSSIENVVD